MDVVGDLERRLYGEGRAARTVAEYCKWARRLQRWCVLNGHHLPTLPPHLVREWVDGTVPPGRESRKQAAVALKHLYTMLGRQDEPWLAVRVPAKRQGKPRPLTEPERVRLRDAAVMIGGRRGVATLGMLQTACRPSEVAGWRWDGIDWDQHRIRFWRPKVRDWHEVPLRPALALQLERFRPAQAEGFLFPGDRGRPHVGPTTVWTWVRYVAQVAEVADVCPRRLRATALSRVLDVTDSLDVAAELAGHRDVSVTKTYYAVTTWRRLEAGAAALD